MGGMGSGGHNKQKHYLEGYQRIDIRKLQKSGLFKKAPSKGSISSIEKWTSRGKETGSASVVYTKEDDFIRVCYTIIYKDTGKKEDRKDKVLLDAVKTNFGERFYFSCPYCYTRTTTILFHGVNLKCRKCANLNYSSSQESSNCMQGRLNKISRKIRKLQKNLK